MPQLQQTTSKNQHPFLALRINPATLPSSYLGLLFAAELSVINDAKLCRNDTTAKKDSRMIKQGILHTDGGSRGNPGPSGIGFVLLADDGRELVTLSEGGAFIGEATNNEAEYQALYWGLANARALDVQHVSVRADSELMVKQVKGEYKVRSEGIRPLFEQVKRALAAFGSYDISHVYRKDNARADALANEAMDTGESVGTFAVPCSAGAQSGLAEQIDCSVSSQARQEELPLVSPVYLNSTENISSTTATTTARSHMSTGYYTLTIKDHFDAAHALVGYPGECRNLHGHTWDIEVSVSGTKLDSVGIVYDFKDLKEDLAGILSKYDHVYLNDVPPFDQINATAEHLARVIYEQLEERLPERIELEEVAVWESPIAKLVYRK